MSERKSKRTLKALRALQGLNQADLARRLGIGRVTLQRIERGSRLPTPEELSRLSNLLGAACRTIFPSVGEHK